MKKGGIRLFASWIPRYLPVPFTEGAASCLFKSAALDGAGNVYAARNITGTGTHGFGNGVTAGGTSSAENIVVVKYGP